MTPAQIDERCLSVVMPAYNEERTIEAIAMRVLRIPQLLELIIVDDCSSDKTSEIASGLAGQFEAIRYARLARNMGKTEALKTGFAMTRGSIVVVQDADLEYDPEEIPMLIEPIIDGHADVVYGSRFLVRKAARVLYFYHYIANRLLTFMSNLFTNMNMTDVETCYKALRGQIARSMVITSSGFGFEIEVTAKIAKLKCPVFEVPISYYGRTYEEGKKIDWRDGIAAVWYIFKFNALCGISQSFKEVPELRPKQRPRDSRFNIEEPALVAGKLD